MGAKNSFSDDDQPISAINIVPFVDIILVVLIAFMVATPVIMNSSINVNLPDAASGEENSTATRLVISIQRDGGYFLNGKKTDLDEIKDFSKQALGKQPNIQAIVSADRETTHGRVISAIDAMKSAGVKRFAISVQK